MNTIVCGDCVEQMRRLAAGSVDLVFADPPFNIGFSYDVYKDALPIEQYVGWSSRWMKQVHRILKNDGTFWLAIGDEYAAELKVEARKIGFHCRSWVIWYYTFGVNCSRKFTRSHAHLFHFVKDPENFVFRSDELSNRVPSARQLVYKDTRANSRGRLPDDTWIIPPAGASGEMMEDSPWMANVAIARDNDQTWTLRPQDIPERLRPEEDTWYFPRVAGTFKERAGFHGCQMPEQLLGRIIKTCSTDDAVVLDPFSGSATTVAVAKKLGRRFLAFDLSEEYVRLGQKRLEGIRVGDSLDGSPEPQVSAPPTDQAARKTFRTRKPSPGGEVLLPAEPPVDDSRRQRMTLEGVVEAFASVYDGYSVDRVVADPELNERFCGTCARQGLAGGPRLWNTLLFRQRKAGRLAEYPAMHTTNLEWSECDSYVFASEIALRRMQDQSRDHALSLDEILCDPELARKFDQLAGEFAPGFKPLQYRWAALKLRKQSKLAWERSQRLPAGAVSANEGVALKEFDAAEVGDGSGLYLIGEAARKDKTLYAGEAMSLRERLKSQFDRGLRQVWEARAEELGMEPNALRVWVLPTWEEGGGMLTGQKRLIDQYDPRLNVASW